MKKVYVVCDYIHDNAHLCGGRILREDGTQIGVHYSSSFNWLRHDLKSKLDNPDHYEIIDLIGEKIPERFL